MSFFLKTILTINTKFWHYITNTKSNLCVNFFKHQMFLLGVIRTQRSTRFEQHSENYQVARKERTRLWVLITPFLSVRFQFDLIYIVSKLMLAHNKIFTIISLIDFKIYSNSIMHVVPIYLQIVIPRRLLKTCQSLSAYYFHYKILILLKFGS